MFEVKGPAIGTCYISDGKANYLHSDGSVFLGATEYFPTRKMAQAVLDKFYPKPKHVWEHGDVFESGHPGNQGTMMYTQLISSKPKLIYLLVNDCVYSDIGAYLENAKFLFNIREKT